MVIYKQIYLFGGGFFFFKLLSTMSVEQIKTSDSRIRKWLINEFLTDSSIQGICHKSSESR